MYILLLIFSDRSHALGNFTYSTEVGLGLITNHFSGIFYQVEGCPQLLQDVEESLETYQLSSLGEHTESYTESYLDHIPEHMIYDHNIMLSDLRKREELKAHGVPDEGIDQQCLQPTKERREQVQQLIPSLESAWKDEAQEVLGKASQIMGPGFNLGLRELANMKINLYLSMCQDSNSTPLRVGVYDFLSGHMSFEDALKRFKQVIFHELLHTLLGQIYSHPLNENPGLLEIKYDDQIQQQLELNQQNQNLAQSVADPGGGPRGNRPPPPGNRLPPPGAGNRPPSNGDRGPPPNGASGPPLQGVMPISAMKNLVHNHLHLYATYKTIYQALGRNQDLENLIELESKNGGPYQLTWQMVENQNAVTELVNEIKSRQDWPTEGEFLLQLKQGYHEAI